MRLALVLLLVGFVASCHRAPPANPHYVLGDAYQADGIWYYPRESYEASETGLAMVYPAGHADFTTDGELFDQAAMAAAHQTLQLPAIAQLTNLENGRQVLVRINDRGPATPHRLIEMTRRTATLLGIPFDGVVRVQLEVLPKESQAAVEAVPGAPKLQLTSAPIGEVRQSDLPPPGSAAAPRNVVAQQAAPAAADAGCNAGHTPAGDTDAGRAVSRQPVRAARSVPGLPICQHAARARRARRECGQPVREWRPGVSRHHGAVHNGATGR